jgi:hypothetical protein
MEAIHNGVFSDVGAITYRAHLSQLVPALERLDGILSKAIADARTGVQQLESSVKKEPETDQSFGEAAPDPKAVELDE